MSESEQQQQQQGVCRIRILVLVTIFFIHLEIISARLVDTEKNDEDVPIESVRSIIGEVNGTRNDIPEERGRMKSVRVVLEGIRNDFQYPVSTRLEVVTPEGYAQAPIRFRREENSKVQARKVSTGDSYMSTYYTQRKAIMDKYKSQHKAILARFNRTEESSFLNLYDQFSKPVTNLTDSTSMELDRKFQSSYNDSNKIIRNGPNTTSPDSITQNVSISDSNDDDTGAYAGRNTTLVMEPETRELNSSNLDIRRSLDSASSDFDSSHNISRNIGRNDSDVQRNEVNLNSQYLNVTRSLDSEANNFNSSHNISRNIGRNDSDVRRNEVNLNFPNLNITRSLDSEATNFNSSSHNISRSIRQDDIQLQRSGTLLDSRVEKNSVPEVLSNLKVDTKDSNYILEPNSTITGGGTETPEFGAKPRNFSNILTDSFVQSKNRTTIGTAKSIVKVYASPGVRLLNNIMNVGHNRTVHGNTTHEVVRWSDNGEPIVNNIADVSASQGESAVENWTTLNIDHETANPTPEPGGAREEEWCGTCPHDYKWGDCVGKVFFQHNIFLKNHGGSSADVIFGMAIDGPVRISCVEALRFNNTRALVTLHAGGPGFDHAKLRIRGFENEGFSYIMIVWGSDKTKEAEAVVPFPYPQ